MNCVVSRLLHERVAEFTKPQSQRRFPLETSIVIITMMLCIKNVCRLTLRSSLHCGSLGYEPDANLGSCRAVHLLLYAYLNLKPNFFGTMRLCCRNSNTATQWTPTGSRASSRTRTCGRRRRGTLYGRACSWRTGATAAASSGSCTWSWFTGRTASR